MTEIMSKNYSVGVATPRGGVIYHKAAHHASKFRAFSRAGFSVFKTPRNTVRYTTVHLPPKWKGFRAILTNPNAVKECENGRFRRRWKVLDKWQNVGSELHRLSVREHSSTCSYRSLDSPCKSANLTDHSLPDRIAPEIWPSAHFLPGTEASTGPR